MYFDVAAADRDLRTISQALRRAFRDTRDGSQARWNHPGDLQRASRLLLLRRFSGRTVERPRGRRGLVRLDPEGSGYFDLRRHYVDKRRVLILSRLDNPTVTRLSSVRTHRRATAEPLDETADEAGLQAAFVSYGGELFGFARRSLNDSGLAEEAVQETFMRAWRSRQRFDSSLGSLRNWLFTIERRVIIDLAHRRASNNSVELVHDPAVVDNQAENAMLGWQVEEAMRRLRPEHRAVVYDIYFKNRSGREVAARLGVPEGTVRSRLFYALRSLRLVLEEMGWEQ
jgi:RNA polymerase sigma-70 factor (ECF subfamily)